MKFLIVGLGNIGSEYKGTRHNIGFDVVDKLVVEGEQTFETGRLVQVLKRKIKGRQVVVIKPSTFMNLSGKAVKYWMDKENIVPENVLVICDDIALPFGVCRMRIKGGHGGHNGLTDIIEQIGTDSFPRIRFGLGNDFPRGMQADFVLGKWTDNELKILPERIGHAVKMIESFVFAGAANTMTSLNNK